MTYISNSIVEKVDDEESDNIELNNQHIGFIGFSNNFLCLKDKKGKIPL